MEGVLPHDLGHLGFPWDSATYESGYLGRGPTLSLSFFLCEIEK